MAQGIENWEADIRRYLEAGGQRPQDRELINIFMKILPNSVQEKIMWDLHNYPTYEALKEYVRSRVGYASGLAARK